MEKLSHLILDAVNGNEWKALRMRKDGPTLSYLMFLDDLLLIGEAKDTQMTCVLNTLTKFYDMSCQEINRDKTCIMFSNNVTRSTRSKMLQMSGYHNTTDMGKYLGVPLRRKGLRRIDY